VILTEIDMAKKNTTDWEKVSDQIQKLGKSLEEIVEFVLHIISSADKSIAEQIKWNSPSYYYSGEMKAVDPKRIQKRLCSDEFRPPEYFTRISNRGKNKRYNLFVERQIYRWQACG